MAFRIGQKVVCVSADTDVAAKCNNRDANGVNTGKIYTIREIDTRYVAFFGFAGIRLAGVFGPSRYVLGCGLMEAAYPAPCFRPLLEKKTDMDARRAVFEAMKDVRNVVIPIDERV